MSSVSSQEALKIVQQAMQQLVPNFTAGNRQAITPKMLSTQEIANALGLDTSAYSVDSIKKLLDASTNASYDSELTAQKNTENAYLRGLADVAAQIDAIKAAEGSSAYSGMNKGMQNANALSVLLDAQKQSTDDLTTLMQNRGTIASGKTTALTQNASDALTQYNTIAQMLATLSKDNYANQIQQQTNELEANATYDDTNAGYYAANANTLAGLLQSILNGNTNSYYSGTTGSNGTAGSASATTDTGSGASASNTAAGMSAGTKKIIESMIGNNALQKSASTVGSNPITKATSAQSDTSKLATGSAKASLANILGIGNPFSNTAVATSQQQSPVGQAIVSANNTTVDNAVNNAMSPIVSAIQRAAGTTANTTAKPAITSTGPRSNSAIKNNAVAASAVAPSNFNQLVNANTTSKLLAAAKTAAASSLAKTSSVKSAAKK